MSAPKVDVLAYHDALIASHKALSSDAYHVQELPKAEAARAAVAELIEADKEVDAIEDEMNRVRMAGPRHGSYGTGWELRDAAAHKERQRRHEAAHKRRAAALARVGGAA